MRALALCLLFVCSVSTAAAERGRLRLHNILQPTGWETYSIEKTADGYVLTSIFEDSDRGIDSRLETRLEMRDDLRPTHFRSKGKPERDSEIDVDETVDPKSPARAFTVARFAPISVQMLLLRYWKRDPSRAIQRIPGKVAMKITDRGIDVVNTGGAKRRLRKYTIEGVIWGAETLWLDEADRVIGAITQGNNQFEAIAEGYEELLPFFVRRAAEDRMQAFAEHADAVGGARWPRFAIVGARLFDGSGAPPIDDAVIVVERGRIVAAGRRRDVRVPRGAKRIDARGATVIPGLWDMHAHFNQVEWGPAYLAAGVTTIRDCGNETELIDAIRRAVESGRGVGPRILRALEVDGDHPGAVGTNRVRSADDARAQVERAAALGVEQMKLYNSVPPELVPVITREAHARGMTVTGHVPRGMDVFDFINAGADQINHISFIYKTLVPNAAPIAPAPPVDLDSDAARRLFALLAERGTVVDPTLGQYEFEARTAATPIASFEPSISKVPESLVAVLAPFHVPAEQYERVRRRFDDYLRIVGALHRARVPIVAGTDMLVPGHSLHREIELYVRAGMTPAEAIHAATAVPAAAMRLDRETGTIQPGKRADLVIIDGNPLENISDIRKIRTVIANGRLLEPATLWRSVEFKP